VFTPKQIAFPETTKLSELFDSFTLRTATEHLQSVRTDGGHTVSKGGHISGRDGLKCFHAEPTDAVLDYISNSMLNLDRDSLYFEVVIRNDGRALVVVKHNNIIGSRWLALLDASELPA